MSLPPMVLRRLTREIAHLHKAPPEGIAIELGEHDLLDVNGWIHGPAGTPYAGGYFGVNLSFVGTDFPAGPPRCTMRTKVFHPNIAANGEICVSTLKRDWQPSYGIEHILVVIKCLLISPNPDSALDPEAGRLLQDAYSDYAATAAIWTRVHASYRPECMPADPAAPTTSQLPDTAATPATRGPAADVEPPIASFQAMALHPHKKREVSSAKSAGAEANDQRNDAAPVSYTYGAAANGNSACEATSHPLQRSGSTNAELKHKSSFDIAAQSGSGLVTSSALSSGHVRGTAGSSPEAAPPMLTSPRNAQGIEVLATLPSLNAETESMTRRLRDVSLDVPSKGAVSSDLALQASSQKSAGRAPARRTRPTPPVAIVRRGIKRL